MPNDIAVPEGDYSAQNGQDERQQPPANWMQFLKCIGADRLQSVCEALERHNTEKVEDLYGEILEDCAYRHSVFMNKPQGAGEGFLRPLVASVHYGCGLLGCWFALIHRGEPEYFEHLSAGGWSFLSKSGRIRFESFYRNELPLRAHMASIPFIRKPILIWLDVSDSLEAAKIEALKKQCKDAFAVAKRNAQPHEGDDFGFLYLGRHRTLRLHHWLLSAAKIDRFLDGDDLLDNSDPGEDWILKTRNAGTGEVPDQEPVFSDAEWRAICDVLDGAIPGLLPPEPHRGMPNTDEEQQAMPQERRSSALRTFISNLCPARHGLPPPHGGTPNTDEEQRVMTQKRRGAALRTLISSLYSALHLTIFGERSPDPRTRLEQCKPKAILVCVAPLYTRPAPSEWEEVPGYEYCDFANLITAFLVTDQPEYETTDALTRFIKQTEVLERIVLCLGRVEQLALSYNIRSGDLTAENIIRECCVVDKSVLSHLNRWGKWFRKVLGDFRDEDKYATEFLTKIIEEDDLMVGASTSVLELFSRLRRRAEARWNADRGEPREFDSVFLYSEPGCGKENIAKFIHLCGMSRWHGLLEDGTSFKRTWEERNVLGDLVTVNHERSWQEWLNKWNDLCEEDTPDFQVRGEAHEILFKCPANYYVVNCGRVRKETEFEELLFGRIQADKPINRKGAVLAAHMTAGTVFCDEFHTLEKQLDAKLLHFFEKPYRFSVRSESEGTVEEHSFKAGILVIIAANKDQVALIREADLNPAVVFRATENSFRIPPLRERKEDIAIFVLHRILKKKEKNRCLEHIHRISTEGIRLICEMNWEENYRGIRGFLNTLFETREARGIETYEITFEEVVRALQVMDALRSGPSSLRKELGVLI